MCRRARNPPKSYCVYCYNNERAQRDMANDDHNREMIAKLKRKYRTVGECSTAIVHTSSLSQVPPKLYSPSDEPFAYWNNHQTKDERGNVV